MSPVSASNSVLEAVQGVKAGAPAFCTNFFPDQKKLDSWIAHGELLAEIRAGAAFFLRQDRDFWHLYFCAADEVALQRGLSGLAALKTHRITTDVVGKENSFGGLMDVLDACGFCRRSQLQRMARAGKPGESTIAADGKVTLAGHADAPAALQLLESDFDQYTDQLPAGYELEAAIEAGQVLAVKSDGALAALLFFETQGFTSSVRYWAVAAPFRAQRLGSALMRHYLASHSAVRRFILWVVSDNQNAIEKYQHYGYAEDGLIDHVLVNDLIPA